MRGVSHAVPCAMAPAKGGFSRWGVFHVRCLPRQSVRLGRERPTVHHDSAGRRAPPRRLACLVPMLPTKQARRQCLHHPPSESPLCCLLLIQVSVSRRRAMHIHSLAKFDNFALLTAITAAHAPQPRARTPALTRCSTPPPPRAPPSSTRPSSGAAATRVGGRQEGTAGGAAQGRQPAGQCRPACAEGQGLQIGLLCLDGAHGWGNGVMS
jgi:hypothetical protein